MVLSAVTVLKFGHKSSDLLAYGASDGTLTVCTVYEPPSVTKILEGHSKDVTGSINWYRFFGLFLFLRLEYLCVCSCCHDLRYNTTFQYKIRQWSLKKTNRFDNEVAHGSAQALGFYPSDCTAVV